jgi:hypothetical protein
MITDPASGIKREVLQLIDLQIETLKRESSLDSSHLQDYQARSERIRQDGGPECGSGGPGKGVGGPLEHHRKEDLDMRMIEPFSRWDQPQARYDRLQPKNCAASDCW